MTTDEMWARADAMIAAADGYAADEGVRFEGDIWSAGLLRETADDLIDSAIHAVMAEMVEATRGFHTDF